MLDLGHAGLRRELGALGGAEHADDGAQLGEGAGRCVLDDGQGLDGTPRGWEAAMARPAWAWMAMPETWWATVSWSSRASCSRFAGLGLVDVTDTDLRAIGGPRRRARRADRKNAYPPHLARQAHGVGDGGDGLPEQDDAEADRGFPTGAPPEQGVGQDERRGRCCSAGRRGTR